MTSNKEYRELISSAIDVPLFYQPWWLDAISLDQSWEGLIFRKGDDVRAIWPVIYKSKMGKKIIYHPPLHAYGGVRMFPGDDQKYASILSMEHEALNHFIERIAQYDWILQKFYPGFTNWLPFYWSGFQQKLRYTYTLDLKSAEDALFADFRENIRREIRKAEKTISIVESHDVSQLYSVLKKSKENVMDFSLNHLTKVYDAAKNAQSIYLLQAKDQNGNIHSMGLFAWDNFAAYYLLGATDPLYKNSGSMSLLMWEAIKMAKTKTHVFNFEGSMIENVERFFRGFGARQHTFFELEKNNSFVFRALNTIKRKIT